MNDGKILTDFEKQQRRTKRLPKETNPNWKIRKVQIFHGWYKRTIGVHDLLLMKTKGNSHAATAKWTVHGMYFFLHVQSITAVSHCLIIWVMRTIFECKNMCVSVWLGISFCTRENEKQTAKSNGIRLCVAHSLYAHTNYTHRNSFHSIETFATHFSFDIEVYWVCLGPHCKPNK